MRCYIHATEAPEKIVFAISKLVGKEPEVSWIKGHFGNDIGVIDEIVRSDDRIEFFLNKLGEMEEEDKERLLRELDDRIEGGSIYLRFDKQIWYLEEKLKPTLSDDAIQVKLTLRGGNPKIVREFMQDLLAS